MRLTCVFTVASERYSDAAISPFDRPRAASPKISRSRGVSSDHAAGAGRRPAPRPTCANSSRVAVAAITWLPWCTVRIAASRNSGSASFSTKPLAPARIARGGVLVEVERGEHEDARRRAAVAVGVGEDALGRGDAVLQRHPHVHEHHVGTSARGEVDRRRPRRPPRRRPRGRAATRRASGRPRGTGPGRRRGPPGCRSCRPSRLGGDARAHPEHPVVAGVGAEACRRPAGRARACPGCRAGCRATRPSRHPPASR